MDDAAGTPEEGGLADETGSARGSRGSRAVRILTLVAGFLLGLVAGVCGVVVSRMDVRMAGLPIPYGLVVAVAATALLFSQARRLGGVAGAGLTVAGWLVPVALALLPRPEGDVLLASDLTGLSYLLLCLLAAAWNVGRPARRDPTVPAHHVGERDT
ncbi:MAG TPA: DUF6113 family protein [Actinopolymorphaceae bacterium]